MPTAIIPDETWKYQFDSDHLTAPERDRKGQIVKSGKPDPDGTWWTLRALSSKTVKRIRNLIDFKRSENGEEAINTNRGEVIELTLAAGVESVENFPKPDGSMVSIERKGDRADLSFMDYLSEEHQVELCNAITNRTKVTPAEGD